MLLGLDPHAVCRIQLDARDRGVQLYGLELRLFAGDGVEFN
jgi:hypothetical protein